ncbi:hypothetical protein LUZ62_040075 [Rhynchospora pubera]|uniref:Uncharacterized protein n=1 Tax=Rhynchospora pubera TaxID=906938 RepID=A0AAV8FB17_9POAL|nr:hypothetical protein LUZ62_040075 [Rhynchospora pubera]
MLTMDAVELPMPTSLVNPKVVLQDLSGRAVGTEIRGSENSDASVPSRGRDSACSSSRSDVKYPLQSPDRFSKRPADFLVPLKLGTNSNPSSRSETSSRRPFNGESSMILSLPKQDNKALQKRSVKMLTVLPCSTTGKRPKVEQGEVALGMEIDDSKISENVRVLKHKRCVEGKRTDRKHLRNGIRSKHDFSTSKSGFINFDSTFGGNSILGMYGLKPDPHDITKNMQEPSLEELLEGGEVTGKYTTSASREKGKRPAVCTKDEFLIFIRKAYSMLPVPTDSASGNNRKDSGAVSSSVVVESDNKVQSSDDPVLLSKDSSQVRYKNTELHQPKDVLRRLTLPQDRDLNSLLVSLTITSTPCQNPVNYTPLHGSSLPPLPWSTAPSGTHKPIFYSGKVPWVKICSDLTSQEPAFSLFDLEKMEKEVPCEEKIPGLGTDSTCKKEHPDNCHTDNHDNVAGVSGQTTKQVHSPTTMRAAEILCEISSSSDSCNKQKHTNGAVCWSNSTSQLTVKARKPLLPPAIRTDNTSTSSLSPSRNFDPPSRSFSIQSSKYRVPMDRKNHNHDLLNRTSSPTKGAIRWPVPIDPRQQQSRGNGMRHQNSPYSSQARLERDYENQQKIKKATLAASLGTSSGFGDWNRPRNKRI